MSATNFFHWLQGMLSCQTCGDLFQLFRDWPRLHSWIRLMVIGLIVDRIAGHHGHYTSHMVFPQALP